MIVRAPTATYWQPLLLVWIVTIGALIRCHRLNEVGFWFDESFSWKMTTFAWGEILGRVAQDNHPPIYFLLLKAWTACWGESATAMRLLSVLCGVATILGGYWLVREIEQRSGPAEKPAVYPSALYAATLLALSPFQIQWSQQVRMYALGSALTVWSSWFLIRALHGRSGGINWLGYILTASALAYTHYFGLLILGSQFVYSTAGGLQQHQINKSPTTLDSSPICVVFAFVIVGMTWIPWLPVFLAHQQQVVELFPNVELTPKHLLWANLQMWIGMWTRWHYDPRLAWGVASVSVAFWCWQIVAGKGGARLLALGPLFMFFTAVSASIGSRSIIKSRYFIFAHALAVCGFAVGLNRISRRWMKLGFSGLALVGMSWLCWQNIERREGWAAHSGFERASAYLQDVRRPGEPVIVGSPMVQINLAAYLADREQVYVLGERQSFPYYEGTAVMRDSEYLTANELSAASGRAWVIATKNWTGGTISVALPESWIEIQEESFRDWYTPNCELVVKECVRRRSAGVTDRLPVDPADLKQPRDDE